MTIETGSPSGSGNDQIDDRLIINNSDLISLKLVTTPYDGGIGFQGWKRSMLIALSAKNKIAFIDGSFKTLVKCVDSSMKTPITLGKNFRDLYTFQTVIDHSSGSFVNCWTQRLS